MAPCEYALSGELGFVLVGNNDPVMLEHRGFEHGPGRVLRTVEAGRFLFQLGLWRCDVRPCVR